MLFIHGFDKRGLCNGLVLFGSSISRCLPTIMWLFIIRIVTSFRAIAFFLSSPLPDHACYMYWASFFHSRSMLPHAWEFFLALGYENRPLRASVGSRYWGTSGTSKCYIYLCSVIAFESLFAMKLSTVNFGIYFRRITTMLLHVS